MKKVFSVLTVAVLAVSTVFAGFKKDKDIKKKFNMQEDKKELQELIKKEKKKKALEKKKLEKGKS